MHSNEKTIISTGRRKKLNETELWYWFGKINHYQKYITNENQNTGIKDFKLYLSTSNNEQTIIENVRLVKIKQKI